MLITLIILYETLVQCLTVWIKNPYGEHHVGCMDYDAHGHQSIRPDINKPYM